MPDQPRGWQAPGVEGECQTVRDRDSFCCLRTPAVDLEIGKISLRAAANIADFLSDTRNGSLIHDSIFPGHPDIADHAVLPGQGNIGKAGAVRQCEDAFEDFAPAEKANQNGG